ncbi:MAG: hypothetical protein GX785_08430 [Armatimonadetes bacterium]|nr:hypothetical protein [Armatimonadota bacterium]
MKEADKTLEIRVTKVGMMTKLVGVVIALLVGLTIAKLIPNVYWVYGWGFVAGLVGGLFAAIWGTELKVNDIPFDES